MPGLRCTVVRVNPVLTKFDLNVCSARGGWHGSFVTVQDELMRYASPEPVWFGVPPCSQQPGTILTTVVSALCAWASFLSGRARARGAMVHVYVEARVDACWCSSQPDFVRACARVCVCGSLLRVDRLTCPGERIGYSTCEGLAAFALIFPCIDSIRRDPARRDPRRLCPVAPSYLQVRDRDFRVRPCSPRSRKPRQPVKRSESHGPMHTDGRQMRSRRRRPQGDPLGRPGAPPVQQE